MKTTVDIPDSLFEEIRGVAVKQGTTLREILIDSLRQVLSKRKRAASFRLRKASFKGKGLQEGVLGASWERIREMAYETRGS